MKKLFSTPLLLVVCAGFLSAGWQNYHAEPLKPFFTELTPPFSLKKGRVEITAKKLTPDESKQYLGKDLISRGVQPIQLTIQNNTANEYSICPSSVDLPRVEVNEIAFRVTKSAVPRAVAYKIASLLFWPFMIPSTIDSIKTFTAHKNLKKDLKAKSIKQEVVTPFSTCHRILWVPLNEVEETFAVTLIDLDSLDLLPIQVSTLET